MIDGVTGTTKRVTFDGRRINVCLTKSQSQALAQASKKIGMEQAAVIRLLLIQYLPNLVHRYGGFGGEIR